MYSQKSCSGPESGGEPPPGFADEDDLLRAGRQECDMEDNVKAMESEQRRRSRRRGKERKHQRGDANTEPDSDGASGPQQGPEICLKGSLEAKQRYKQEYRQAPSGHEPSSNR